MPDEIPQFIGEYEDVPVDPKGRLIVPSAIRKELPLGVNSFVVARWFDGCLAGFDPGVWHRVLQQLLALDGGQRQARQLRRSVAGGAMEAKIDPPEITGSGRHYGTCYRQRGDRSRRNMESRQIR